MIKKVISNRCLEIFQIGHNDYRLGFLLKRPFNLHIHDYSYYVVQKSVPY